MQEQKCALRALTLCDGDRVLTGQAHSPSTGCYCEALDRALTDGHELLGQGLRTDRARAVARSAETLRRVDYLAVRIGGEEPPF